MRIRTSCALWGGPLRPSPASGSIPSPHCPSNPFSWSSPTASTYCSSPSEPLLAYPPGNQFLLALEVPLALTQQNTRKCARARNVPCLLQLLDYSGESSAFLILVGRVTLIDRIECPTFRAPHRTPVILAFLSQNGLSNSICVLIIIFCSLLSSLHLISLYSVEKVVAQCFRSK